MTVQGSAVSRMMRGPVVLELAVPVVSFGATLLGVLAWQAGYTIAFQYFAFGCVIGSCVLAYLAWIRPRKDIVALSTPLYALIFFIVPADFTSGLILQLLYAVSLTILLIRLKCRFGTPATEAVPGRELASPIRDYAEKARGGATLSPAEGHQAAVVVSRFASGDYAGAARAAGQPPAEPAILARAYDIAREHAEVLDRGLKQPEPFRDFLPEDSPLLAIRRDPGSPADLQFDTALNNALLFLFAVAWHSSPADRPHLLACRGFLAQLLGP